MYMFCVVRTALWWLHLYEHVQTFSPLPLFPKQYSVATTYIVLDIVKYSGDDLTYTGWCA